MTPKYTRVGYAPVQPVPFSHALHAGQLGIDCRYCHSYVEKLRLRQPAHRPDLHELPRPDQDHQPASGGGPPELRDRAAGARGSRSTRCPISSISTTPSTSTAASAASSATARSTRWTRSSTPSRSAWASASTATAIRRPPAAPRPGDEPRLAGARAPRPSSTWASKFVHDWNVKSSAKLLRLPPMKRKFDHPAPSERELQRPELLAQPRRAGRDARVPGTARAGVSRGRRDARRGRPAAFLQDHGGLVRPGRRRPGRLPAAGGATSCPSATRSRASFPGCRSITRRRCRCAGSAHPASGRDPPGPADQARGQSRLRAARRRRARSRPRPRCSTFTTRTGPPRTPRRRHPGRGRGRRPAGRDRRRPRRRPAARGSPFWPRPPRRPPGPGWSARCGPSFPRRSGPSTSRWPTSRRLAAAQAVFGRSVQADLPVCQGEADRLDRRRLPPRRGRQPRSTPAISPRAAG